MTNWFTPRETYSRDIKHPDTEDVATVEFRVLNAGDRAALEDTIRIEAEDPQMQFGAMKLLTVERAVVSWSLEVAPTRATLEQLHPEVLEAIFSHVSFGKVPDTPLESSSGEKSSKNKSEN